MRSRLYVVLLAALGASLVAGCAGGAQSSNPLFPGSAVGGAAKPADDLYVADVGANAIELLSNTGYKKAGTIKDKISGPTDVFLDAKGRLYVADADGQRVTEYESGKSVPSFIYNVSMNYPYTVTVDTQSNLFEGDLYGVINEYAQGINTVVAGCSVPGPVFGLAVDASGDVFADYFGKPMGPAKIVEYRGGLTSSCNAKTIAKSAAPGGIALDKNGKLVVAEGSKVVVIDPGNANAAVKIGSGFAAAVNVHLSKDNTQAFVTDNENNTVTVVSYPAGTNVTVLGTDQGLKAPRAAVDWPNAVY